MNYRVHIKIADRGWILERCASEIVARSNRISFGVKADPRADIQYYINYSCYREKVSPIEVGYFTHIEKDEAAAQRFFEVATKMDYCVSHSKRYAGALREAGIVNVEDIPPGVDLDLFKPKVRIGVVGRTYHTGRKGEKLIAQVMNIPGIEWRFTGAGWPGPSTYAAPGDMPKFYNDLDYVLVPALYEGGPMSVVEGLACGIPIITSDVGWATEFPHIYFENNNAESLRCVLEGLVAERAELRKAVLKTTWDAWALRHIELFERLAARNIGRNSVRVAGADIRKPRILIATHGTEGKNKGGPTSRVANIVRLLKETDVEVEHIAPPQKLGPDERPDLIHVFNSWPLKTANEQLTIAKRSGAAVVYSPIALNLNFLPHFSKSLPSILETSVSSRELDINLRALRRLTAPYVPGKGKPAEGIPDHFSALRTGVQLADHVIYLSEFERTFLADIGAQPKSSSIIRNGVDVETMAKGDPDRFANAFGFRDFVLIVGRIEARKNQALAVYALRDIDAPVVLLGHVGDPAYFELVKKWAGPNFVHIERIDDREMLASAYKAARCLVLSSWAEGAPLAAIEAAAAGTPLVLSTMSGEIEYFADFASYVHPCDTDALKTAVRDLVEKPESAARREQRSQMAVAAYGVQKHASETLHLYEGVLQARSSGRETAAEREPETILDITHIAHQVDNNQNLTGVTAVEYSVGRAIMQMHPELRAVVWNSPNRVYVETKFDDLLGENPNNVANVRDLPMSEESVTSLVWSPPAESAQPAPAAPTVQEQPTQPAPIAQFTAKRFAISTAKQTLNALPAPVRVFAITSITRAKPNFNPIVLPEHRVFGREKSQEGYSEKNHRKPAIAPGHGRPKALAAYQMNALPLLPNFVPGDRLLLLGQPWISNDRMLDDLCTLVRDKGLNLWAHVPDILYVVDSDSFDQQTRRVYRRRLQKLLEITHTAIVISNAAENDVRQLVDQLGLKTRTCRIRLGSNNQLAETTPKPPAVTLPKRFVMYVSSMNQRKRHDFAHEVWTDAYRKLRQTPEHKDVGLLLVGRPQNGFERYGDPAFQKELRKHNVFVMSDVSADELAWLYRNCLFTIYPSRAEGWGIPPLESLSFGKACIVSECVPSAAETDSNALIKLPPDDYFGWVRAIENLVRNPEYLATIRESARSFRQPSWEDAARVLFKNVD